MSEAPHAAYGKAKVLDCVYVVMLPTHRRVVCSIAYKPLRLPQLAMPYMYGIAQTGKWFAYNLVV